MPIASDCVLLTRKTADGICLKIVGRASMKLSRVAYEFVADSLEGGIQSAVIDLAECQYLDSTSLGCLVQLHRRFNSGPSPRVVIAANSAKMQSLPYLAHLGAALKFIAIAPECIGPCVPLSAGGIADKTALMQHVMDCHNRLAEIDGPDQAKFGIIAKHLAGEIAGELARHSSS